MSALRRGLGQQVLQAAWRHSTRSGAGPVHTFDSVCRASTVGCWERFFSSQAAQEQQFASRSAELIAKEQRYTANNYKPVPVVFSRALGAVVWDADGKTYLDFLSGYSAINQGHSHPKIIKAITEQAQLCALTARAFHNDRLPDYAELLTKLLGYESMLPTNTGAEAVDSALKLARKWGYTVKGIPANQAQIVSCCGCFHGRSFGAVAMSCDPDATTNFGPALPGMLKVDYGDLKQLEETFEKHGPTIAAFIFEPIQGEAGVIVPPDGYHTGVRELCSKHNILMIADEVQTGLCRTGSMLAIDHEGVRPDIVTLGKALSGGTMPVSAIVADRHIMDCFQPNQHGSTFGGSPLTSAVAVAALNVLVDEQLAERAQKHGELMHSLLQEMKEEFSAISSVRGRGLLQAIDIDDEYIHAYDICKALKARGVLSKNTQSKTIRFAPPLVVSEVQLREAMDTLRTVLREDLPRMRDERAGVPVSIEVQTCERCGRQLN